MLKKRIKIIFGWLLVFGLLALSFIFIDNYSVEETDFIQKTGKITGKVIITKDEYGIKDTSLRLHLEDDKAIYSMPGKLLAKSNAEVYQLKNGDEIELILKEKSKTNFIFRNLKLNPIWGISKKGENPYLSLEAAIAHHRSSRTLLYAGLFFAMAIWLTIYLNNL